MFRVSDPQKNIEQRVKIIFKVYGLIKYITGFDRIITFQFEADLLSKFDINAELEALWQVGIDTENVDPTNAKQVLDFLLKLKNKYNANLIATPQDGFNELIAYLKSWNYIIADNVENYKKEISTALSLRESEVLAVKNKHFLECIKIAKIYKNKYVKYYIDKADAGDRVKVNLSLGKAILWLSRAIEYNANINLDDYIDLNHFFNLFDHIRGDIFKVNPLSLNGELLLTALEKSKSIEMIRLDEAKHIGPFLTALMSRTKAMETLYLCGFNVINTKNIAHLAEGLQLNSSIKSIHIGQDIIDDDTLINLLQGLKNNPKSKLTDLYLGNTQCTDRSAKVLIEHLSTNNTIEYVNFATHTIDINIINKINELLHTNTEANKERRQLERAFVRGSSIGFFSQFKLPCDLGRNMAPYLSEKDGCSLAQTATLLLQKAKSERVIEEDKINIARRLI